jgi:hypothetical protein
MRLKFLVILTLITLVASVSPTAHAQTFSVIHSFTGSGGDGAYPHSGVSLRGGAIYDTTRQGGIGGVNGPGTVYQMTHVGNNWIYAPIFLFPADGSGGNQPNARVVFRPDSHLYGTAPFGGSYNSGVDLQNRCLLLEGKRTLQLYGKTRGKRP